MLIGYRIELMAKIYRKNTRIFLVLLTCFMVFFAFNTTRPVFASSHNLSFDAQQKSEIETIIKDYILENPAVIIDALRSFEASRNEAQQVREKRILANIRKDLERDSNTPSDGPENAKVTVVEFFDYRCPYCKKVGPLVAKLLQDNEDVRVAYKEWPILGPDSVLSARAALAAREQGKYREIHEAIMPLRNVTKDTVFQVAEKIGLDVDQLRDDMGSEKISSHLKKTMELARALGINGTPAFVIGDRVIKGATNYEGLMIAVEEARKREQ